MANVYNSQLDAFELYHRVQEPSYDSTASNGSALQSLGHGLAGSAGSALSNVITYPLDLIITRLQIQRQLRKNSNEPGKDEYKGLEDAARKIYDGEGGLKGFYTGVVQDTAKTIADSFLFFLLYSFLRDRRLSSRGNARSLPALEELSVGFVAGSITKLVTTPIANVVTRKQAAAFTGAKGSGRDGSLTTQDIVDDIMKQKGMLGFWSGYSASLVLTLNPSLTFFLYETLKRLTLPRSRRQNPPPSATFLLSAVSKACASSVTYPFSLAKARLQAGGNTEREEEKSTVESNIQSEKAKKAARTTIFSTLLTIAKNEGLSALYEGLYLEILKAFFSHGITMLVKQAIQRGLVKVYYIISIMVSRYRKKVGGQRMASKAKQSVEYYNLAMARASERIEEATNVVKSKAHETAEFVAEYVEEEDGEWRDLYGTVGLAKWLEGDRK